MTRPIQVTAWMLGHYRARVDDSKFLSDVPLWNLDSRYVAELERRAYKEVAALEEDRVLYNELRQAYSEIGYLKTERTELRRLLRLANERVL